jgi:hypothetical protein
MLDRLPSLAGRSYGKFDPEAELITFIWQRNLEMNLHVACLAFVTFEGIALVLLDHQDLHRENGILALGHLDEWKVRELQASVVLPQEVVVNVGSVLFVVVIERLELVIPRRDVEDLLDAVGVLRTTAVTSDDMNLPQSLETSTSPAVLALTTCLDKVIRRAAACELGGKIVERAGVEKGAVGNVDIDG